jgi:hypothetical protein
LWRSSFWEEGDLELVVGPYVRSDDGANMIPMGAHAVVNAQAIDARLLAFLKAQNKEAA